MSSHQMTCFPIPKATINKLEAKQRDYWWGKDSPKGLYLKSWSAICKPKSVGGLGFKNLQLFNKSLMAKLAWRMLTEQDQLWVKVLKHKYFPSSSPLNPIQVRQGSWVWKGIQQGLEVVQQLYIWEVKNGESIHIWKDAWIPGVLPNTLPIPQNQGLIPYMVADLIFHNSKQWNRDLIETVFEPEIASKILSIRLPLQGCDRIHWKPVKKGCFTVKSTYLELTQPTSQQAITSNGFNQWNLIWKLPTINPRVRLFLWKCLNDLLPTKTKISSIINLESTCCNRCPNQQEDTKHILLECPIAKAIWFALPFNIIWEVNENITISDWILSWLQNEHQQVDNNEHHPAQIVSLAAWYIWKERCSNVFEGKQSDPRQTARIIMQHLYIIMSLYGSTDSLLQDTTFSLSWSPHFDEFVKINCDASFKINAISCGIGLIIRGNAGAFKAARAISRQAVSAENAESLAISEAVKWAMDMNLRKVCFESDSLSIINNLKGQSNNIHWSNDSILSDCKYLLGNFSSWSCNFAARLCNKPADKLAKLARKNRWNRSWYEEPPAEICGDVAILVMWWGWQGGDDIAMVMGWNLKKVGGLLPLKRD
ncbi:Reverse transcriptase zinc-binding domain [Macleaya cordata]|uniref:Reverse transcriptase zinc-binding domain n=1 Tax=Macleaya cordata TaxID=56857 RepID=A0A200QQC1_MACCD|nr:Reverse transcriptase zinc-binding domain [Macleaya cordata]